MPALLKNRSIRRGVDRRGDVPVDLGFLRHVGDNGEPG